MDGGICGNLTITTGDSARVTLIADSPTTNSSYDTHMKGVPSTSTYNVYNNTEHINNGMA